MSISPIKPKKVNFLNNKDMLEEIHKSKNSFSEYIDNKYCNYDIIVENIEEIYKEETHTQAKINKASKLSAAGYAASIVNAIATNRQDKPKMAETKVDPDSINLDDLVFRVLTFEHIPEAPGRKKTPKTTADRHLKLNFYPFKHYILVNGKCKEVGRSHCKNNEFSLMHGSITNALANMFILLVERYSQRSNWRNYTYIDEMKGQALLQLSQMGLQFDEYRSDNPFSYFTMALERSFTGVLNIEKKNQDIRDDLLIDKGAAPSFSRQLALEEKLRQSRYNADNNVGGSDELI